LWQDSERRGFTAELLLTDGNPLVYAEHRVPGATRTLLYYAHYDGQAVDPSRWKQESPFKPILREGRLEEGAKELPDLIGRTGFEPDWRIYARSSSDDTSPIVALLAAMDGLGDANLRPTSNVRVILDGEEEAGSPSLAPPSPAIERYSRPTSCSSWMDRYIPPTGPPWSTEPEGTWPSISPYSVPSPRSIADPSLNVRGMESAYVGDAARTIIPDRATASLDVRLVKETDRDALTGKVLAHVRKEGYHVVEEDPDDATRARYPKIVKVERRGRGNNAYRTDLDDPMARALGEALARELGEDPVRIRGGTVPISPFIEALGFPAVSVPIVNFDNNQHGPNENLRLGHFFRGIVTIAATLRIAP
jgi:acetylornithine deacetylase/succinyl-diaminopimelate desuccinylase-like protein